MADVDGNALTKLIFNSRVCFTCSFETSCRFSGLDPRLHLNLIVGSGSRFTSSFERVIETAHSQRLTLRVSLQFTQYSETTSRRHVFHFTFLCGHLGRRDIFASSHPNSASPRRDGSVAVRTPVLGGPDEWRGFLSRVKPVLYLRLWQPSCSSSVVPESRPLRDLQRRS